VRSDRVSHGANGQLPSGAPLWGRVGQLIDRAPDASALRAHRLHLAAARVWRARGLPVPPPVHAAERYAAAMITAAPRLLERIRSACQGQLMLMKGPEVGSYYEHPSDRPFRDLDLLAEDAHAVQRALIRAGCEQVGRARGYEDAQHLCPLAWPGIPVIIEVHHRPNHPPWLASPSSEAVLALGVASATGVDGLLGPDPAAHALLLLAHSWAHQPLGRLADLVDLAAVLAGRQLGEAEVIARAWGWEGMWRVSVAVAEAILGNREPPMAARVWARHLACARDRIVLENHLARVAAPIWALPGRRAPAALAGVLRSVAMRRDDEPWTQKLRRSRLAFAHALSTKSNHERMLLG